jgi:hypothetical protein
MAQAKKRGIKSSAQDNFLEPLSPVSVTATDVGTGRAYNNGAATVSFSLPEASPAATSYTVTSSPGGFTATGASSPITVQGLQSNTAYTFTVTATNAVGSSAASSASTSITATTVPAQPSAPSASTIANQAQDSVSWSAPENGGKAITEYTWSSSDGKSGSTASTTVTVNQEQGTAQTYTVYATNANGNSSVSSASGSVTTFAFTPYAFTPYSFVPFSFVPFSFTPYAFTPYSFVPFSFIPFSFIPYSFVPYSFVPYSFVPYNFTPSYSFTPLRFCIDQDTPIQVVGENDSTVLKLAKDIVAGEEVWAMSWDQFQDETIDPYATQSYVGEITGVDRVKTKITSVEESSKPATMYINGDMNKRFSPEEKIFIKRGDFNMFSEAQELKIGDSLHEVDEDGSMTLVDVTSVDLLDESRMVYKFAAFPVDTIVAGGIVVHNSKV